MMAMTRDAHETSKTFKTVAKTIYFEPTHANFSRRGCEGRVEGDRRSFLEGGG